MMGGTPDVTMAEWISFAIVLFTFFCGQAVALFIWYRRHKADQKRERVRIEEKQDKERVQQLEKLQAIVDKDIGTVREEVSDIRKEISQQERVQSQRNEQLHGHLRRLEESRPTREEMEKNMAQIKELVVSTKADLERAVTLGFQNIDRRFDEFKDYARDLWAKRGD